MGEHVKAGPKLAEHTNSYTCVLAGGAHPEFTFFSLFDTQDKVMVMHGSTVFTCIYLVIHVYKSESYIHSISGHVQPYIIIIIIIYTI